MQKYTRDVYDKAAVLTEELVKAHAFASGNRRAAFITVKDFVKQNRGKFKIKDDPSNAKVMVGIRESYYSLDGIKEWMKYGEIKEFER